MITCLRRHDQRADLRQAVQHLGAQVRVLDLDADLGEPIRRTTHRGSIAVRPVAVKHANIDYRKPPRRPQAVEGYEKTGEPGPPLVPIGTSVWVPVT